MSIGIQILFSALAIGLMAFLWIRVSAHHEEAMRDVDPCRLRGGCAHCTQHCNDKEQHD